MSGDESHDTTLFVAKTTHHASEHGPSWCFTIKHFLDLDRDMGVRKALSRLEKDKTIRRLAKGLYEYPRTYEVPGTLPPQLEEAAKALAEEKGRTSRLPLLYPVKVSKSLKKITGSYGHSINYSRFPI